MVCNFVKMIHVKRRVSYSLTENDSFLAKNHKENFSPLKIENDYPWIFIFKIIFILIFDMR